VHNGLQMQQLLLRTASSSSSSKWMTCRQQTLLCEQLAAVMPQGLYLHQGTGAAAAAVAVPAHTPAGAPLGGQSPVHGH
jgi:hypothetical protein